jgi:hypothetical protein
MLFDWAVQPIQIAISAHNGADASYGGAANASFIRHTLIFDWFRNQVSVEC